MAQTLNTASASSPATLKQWFLDLGLEKHADYFGPTSILSRNGFTLDYCQPRNRDTRTNYIDFAQMSISNGKSRFLLTPSAVGESSTGITGTVQWQELTRSPEAKRMTIVGASSPEKRSWEYKFPSVAKDVCGCGSSRETVCDSVHHTTFWDKNILKLSASDHSMMKADLYLLLRILKSGFKCQ